jgi:hypothetical protein
MKPLGRFFQVTEAVSARKYFLDIDRIERYPLTFVIKSDDPPDKIAARIEKDAHKLYPVADIVSRYMACIEEIVNVPILVERLDAVVESGRIGDVLDEILRQAKVEFNLDV